MTKLEQIEKLRERANVTYDEAKDALDRADGDLLEALITLERQGKVTPPEGGGYYTSTNEAASHGERANRNHHSSSVDRESFSETLGKIGRFCLDIINKGNASSFEVLKDEQSKAKMPITVLVLLGIFLPWVTIPLIIIGLALGYKYRFNGFTPGDEV